jgi:hypothetical protein
LDRRVAAAHRVMQKWAKKIEYLPRYSAISFMIAERFMKI